MNKTNGFLPNLHCKTFQVVEKSELKNLLVARALNRAAVLNPLLNQVAESPVAESPVAENPVAESPVAESPVADARALKCQAAS